MSIDEIEAIDIPYWVASGYCVFICGMSWAYCWSRTLVSHLADTDSDTYLDTLRTAHPNPRIPFRIMQYAVSVGSVLYTAADVFEIPHYALRRYNEVKPYPQDYRFRNKMGRKAGGLFISPKKFGSLQKPCMKEMITFLNCLALNQCNDEKCVRQKELLSLCMDGQTNKSRKPWGSINYHLQRLNRGRK
ncbi:hypothetical protein Vadar_015311 [Vaccinium darrowii]|uniref:Uncharacterized protein n=1 Tax=Vaccinium darrowii TaxID=229202 RepID=A0ACB7X1C0_9ERIC|nr:hypothetical protein Vadar_015311 [Vaccinium darrowii]